MLALTLSSSRIISAIPGLISMSSGWAIPSDDSAIASSGGGMGKGGNGVDVVGGCDTPEEELSGAGDEASAWSGVDVLTGLPILLADGQRRFR